ncbi:energy-coupling factor transport system substrate-specific component [Pseudobutyrivibrio xylanivorans DSM 14809]|uniref:Energy-coupling factor transport system substrate-specific component n=2 Tax=Pseudobutyrivibrio xylanivorans TaxID=185007 RepID=A0A1M6GBL1_PSEXY|nr:energy-coupling factor transport system substrate-specific component [Pseudobutyrivibrio xylanivorans DSM 14809]
MEIPIPGNMNLQNNMNNKVCFTTKDIALAGMMIAVIEVCKVALSFLPNIELTTFWLIMFTLYFGRKVVAVVPAFILVEGVVYGMNTWWIMYLYIWPLLVLLTWIFRKEDSALFWGIVSGIFGLCFGMLCSITYFFIGLSSGGVVAGFNTAFSWWISGIMWDMVHCAGNFVFMVILYTPIKNVMKMIASRTNC